MKKILRTFLAAAFLTTGTYLCFPSTPFLSRPSVAEAAGVIELNSAQQKQLDDFFTAFSSSGLRSFRKGTLTNDELLAFAVNYNIKHSKNLKNINEKTWGITLQDLTNTVQKYFGLPLTIHDMGNYTVKDGLYLVPRAASSTNVFSKVDFLMDNGDGTYLANVVIYMGSSEGPGASPLIGSRFRALITKTDTGCNLQEYLMR